MIGRGGAAGARFKLLLVGVGGQGVVSAARWLGDAAARAGVEVVVGQLHGMAQRGGNVEATVLFGPGQSSFIGAGGAHAVLALEPLELLRARARMSPATRGLVSLGRVVPPALSLAGGSYPDVAAMLAEVRALAPGLVAIDGPGLVRLAGDARALNVVMLGALAGLELVPIDGATLRAAIERGRPARTRESWRRAFALGLEAVRA